MAWGKRQEIESLPIIQLYDHILDGKIKMFPMGTWSPENGGYDIFKNIFRYLTNDKFGFTREDLITKVTLEFFKKHRLYGALTLLFDYKIHAAINYAYPEFDIKIWELNRSQSWMNPDSLRDATRWLFLEKLKWNREQIINGASKEIFNHHKMRSLLVQMKHHGVVEESNKASIFALLSYSFPEFNIRKEEFKNTQTWNESLRVRAIRNFVKKDLGFDSFEIIRENIHSKYFTDTYMITHYYFYKNNLNNMLQTAFPEYDFSCINFMDHKYCR